MSNKITCMICKEELQSSEEISSTNCGHVYHEACIKSWLQRSETCPQCRSRKPRLIMLYLTFDDDGYSSEGNETTNINDEFCEELEGAVQQLENVVIDSSKITQELHESTLTQHSMGLILKLQQLELDELKESNETLKLQLNEAEENIKSLIAHIDRLVN